MDSKNFPDTNEADGPILTPTNVSFNVEDAINKINLLMAGVIIVMFVGFITLLLTVYGMVITAQNGSNNASQSLRDEVSEQNNKSDELKRQVEGFQKIFEDSKKVQSQQ